MHICGLRVRATKRVAIIVSSVWFMPEAVPFKVFCTLTTTHVSDVKLIYEKWFFSNEKWKVFKLESGFCINAGKLAGARGHGRWRFPDLKTSKTQFFRLMGMGEKFSSKSWLILKKFGVRQNPLTYIFPFPGCLVQIKPNFFHGRWAELIEGANVRCSKSSVTRC